MKENVVKDKSFAFAVRIVNLYKYLVEEKREFVLSKQLLRSGTAIGALTREAEHAESKADFIYWSKPPSLAVVGCGGGGPTPLAKLLYC